MELLNKPMYRFEDIEIDTLRGCLRRSGQEQHLRQQPFQVLLYLLEQRQRLVTKDELIEKIWNGTAVTDNALVQCITDIRKALGDDSRNPRSIKTIPKKGYRFIAEVEEFYPAEPALIEMEEVTSIEIEYKEEITDTPLPPDTPLKLLPEPKTERPFNRRSLFTALVVILFAASLLAYFGQKAQYSNRPLAEVTLPQTPGNKSLAVMYFDNESSTGELDWLRKGLADMFITSLSRSKTLTLLSRQQLYRLLERSGHKPGDEIRLEEAIEIARKVRAEVVVLGSFARLGEKVRVDVRLHDGHTGQLLKAEGFTADRPDQIVPQVDLLSLRLADSLGVKLIEQERKSNLADLMTNNIEAYYYYSLAVEKAEAFDNKNAIAMLEKAVALDPQFAMAYARIGYTYAVTWGFADKGKPYLEKAFQFSERLKEKEKLYITAWYAIANLDFPTAIRTYQEIIAKYPYETDACLTLGYLLKGEERWEDAIAVLNRGLAIDAEEKDIYNALGFLYNAVYRYNDALAAHQRYVGLAPNEPNAHDSLGMTYQQLGRYEEAMAEFNRAITLNAEFHFANLHLADVYSHIGRYKDAVNQYKKYIQIAPSDRDRATGYQRIGKLFLTKGDLEQAAAAAKKEISYDKNFVRNSFIIALERGDMARAERLKERVFSQSPYTQRGGRHEFTLDNYVRGYYELKKGNSQEAINYFQETVRHSILWWGAGTFSDCLADAYFELGELDKAINEYERILSLNPNWPLAHYHLGQVYEQKGLREKARAEYQKFLEVWKDADPDIPEFIAARKKLEE